MRFDLPPIPDRIDPDLRKALTRIREELQALMGTRGSDPAVRLTQITGGPGGSGALVLLPGTGPGGGVEAPDLTPPPTPTFGTGDVVAGISQVIVSWAGINYTQGHGNKQTIVYAVKKDPSDPTMPTFPGDAGIVAIAPHALTLIAIPSEPNTRWHVWLKFETNDGVQSTSPAGGTNGVQATTGQDVAHLLTVLTGQITQSQLFSTLSNRIDLIDAADTVSGSVSAKVKAETDARVAAITLARSDFAAADAATLASANSYVTTYAYSKSTVDGALSALDTTLRAAFASADATTLATANAFTYSRATIDGAISSSATTLTAAYQAADAVVLSAADAAAASRDSTVLATANAFTYSRATIDGAIASSASALTASYGAAISSAVGIEASARAALDGAVQALYTVRTQVSSGGTTMVGGFGLAATATGDGGATIDFGVIANRFYVGAPTGAGLPDRLPFIIQADDTTINGVFVPAGVYMDTAFIRDGTITNAKIGNAAIDDAKVANLSAAKLTVGDGTVGGNLKSASYTGGSGSTPGTGWLLTPGGNVFLNSAIVYGTVYATNGVFSGSLSGASITGATGNFTGTLNGANITGATGTFSGSLNVSSGGSSRVEITTSRIKVFNGGVERVRIGDLS